MSWVFQFIRIYLDDPNNKAKAMACLQEHKIAIFLLMNLMESYLSAVDERRFLVKPQTPSPRRCRSSNLVDPASSHMLVLKIKPCMSKYKYYTAKLRMAH